MLRCEKAVWSRGTLYTKTLVLSRKVDINNKVRSDFGSLRRDIFFLGFGNKEKVCYT